MKSDFYNESLKNLSEYINRGITPSYTEDNGILVLNQKCVRDGKISIEASRLHDNKKKKVSDEKILKKNDILVNSTGVGTLGRVAQKHDETIATVDSHITIVRPKKNKVDPVFLGYLLKQNQSLIESLAEGTTGQTELSRTQLGDLKFDLPIDKNIQRQIGEAMFLLDSKIEFNNRINQTLETIAQTLFKSWFVDFDPVKAKIAAKEQGQDPQLAAMMAISGKTPEQIAQLPADKRKELAATADLFPDEMVESELGMIPRGWKVSNFGQVINCFDSKRIPLSSREREKIKGEYPYYGATSIMDYVDKYIFDGTYLLLGEDGSVIKESGLPYTQFVWGKFWVNNHAHVLQGKNNISTEQLYIFISQTNISEFITGAVQLKLNQGNMNRIPFILAEKDINDSFGEIINPHMSMYKTLFEQNKRLSELRDTLLPKLLSGEIEIG